MSQETTLTVQVAAPMTEVYRALTNSTLLRLWMSDTATTQVRPRGYLFMAWNDGYYMTGAFTELMPDERVAYTWHGSMDPGPTQVTFELQPTGEGTQLTLTHSGLGSGPDWEMFQQQMEQSWRSSLENLQSMLEEGPDLRIVRRPMLGITLSNFDAEVAAQLGVPVTQGQRLDGVLPEMGAAAAGLQPEDVIVSVDGQEVTTFPSLAAALEGKRGGDTVEVVYYRGPEKRTTAMTLSGRPIPEIPAEPAELAARVREADAQEIEELESFLAEVTEEEAEHRPEPDAWNIKQVLAHLVLSERGTLNFVTDLLSDRLPIYDNFNGNANAPLEALIQVYPTVRDLLGALQRQQAETVALLAALPDEFVARKGSYWLTGFSFLQGGLHHRAHMSQMEAALASSRA